jgi:hypothetical protein
VPTAARPATSPSGTIAVTAMAAGVAQGFGRFTYALVLPPSRPTCSARTPSPASSAP